MYKDQRIQLYIFILSNRILGNSMKTRFSWGQVKHSNCIKILILNLLIIKNRIDCFSNDILDFFITNFTQ